MPIKRATQDELQAEIGEWNRSFLIGTEVRAKLYPEKMHKTRTEAMTLFDQKAVIYLEGFNGYFDLHEVNAVAVEAPVSGPPETLQVPADDARSSATTEETQAPISHDPIVSVAPEKRRAVIFPGQGAQRVGMGRDLFVAFPEQTRRASEILGYSIEQLCLEDPDKKLVLTQYTQAALYIVNALSYMSREKETPPDFLMGHSLGEYNALLAAGVFDFETGLRLVKKRGELMGAASGGAMAAVVGLEAERLREVLTLHELDAIDFANYNTPTQTVISGSSEAVAGAVDLLKAENITVFPLKVSAAFHSRYMREAQQGFAEFIGQFSFQPPQRPVIANATARPYEADRIAQTLSDQIVSPVLWTESVRYLLNQGEVEFTEIGSTILTNMVKEIVAAQPV